MKEKVNNVLEQISEIAEDDNRDIFESVGVVLSDIVDCLEANAKNDAVELKDLLSSIRQLEEEVCEYFLD